MDHSGGADHYWLDALNAGTAAAIPVASMLATRDEALHVESDGPPDLAGATVGKAFQQPAAALAKTDDDALKKWHEDSHHRWSARVDQSRTTNWPDIKASHCQLSFKVLSDRDAKLLSNEPQNAFTNKRA